MSEQHDQRLLCPGCSHSIQEQNPPPEAFRYLTINEMKAAGYRCQNFVCYIYIEEDEIFTEDTDTSSGHTAVPTIPNDTMPVLSNTMPAKADDTCNGNTKPADDMNLGSQESIPVAAASSSQPNTLAASSSQPNLIAASSSQPNLVAASSSQPNSRASIRNPWTEDEKDILRAMKAQGHSWNQIAEALPRHTIRSIESKWPALIKS